MSKIRLVILMFLLLLIFSHSMIAQSPPADPVPLPPVPADFRGFDNPAPALNTTQSASSTRATYDCSSQSQLLATDCEALVALYNSTNGDNWNNNSGWLVSSTPCSWHGIICNNQGIVGGIERVFRIELENNGLSGTIPAEIGLLSYMRTLHIGSNDISGTIPPEIGKLTQLDNLHLEGNQLSGTIPTEIGALTKLDQLYLRGNDLTGPIPAEIGNLTILRQLYIGQNSLSGSIPQEIGNLTQLTELDLESNLFTGPIPASIGNLTQLSQFYAMNLQLTGEIPPEIGNLTNMWILNIDGSNLTGNIPPEIGNLTKLWKLNLGANNLSGPIPDTIGNLTDLANLDLYYNQLSGDIPAGFYNLTNLVKVQLQNNRLTGTISPQISNLTNLQELDIDRNQLSGSIPTEIGSLPNLTKLTLQVNGFTSLPESIITSSINTITLGDNVFNFKGNLKSWADIVDPNWRDSQTIPPDNFIADTSTTATDGKIYLRWQPIPYKYNDGYYEILCRTVPGITDVNTYDFRMLTANKAIDNVLLSGLPVGDYYCVSRTISLSNGYNLGTLTSEFGNEISFSVPQNFPPVNDTFESRQEITSYPFMYFTLNIANATLEANEPEPECTTLSPNARSIYFLLKDGGPGTPNPYGEYGVTVRGARGIFGARNTGTTRTIMAAYVGDSLDTLRELDCVTFDTINSVEMELFTKDTQDYTIIVWEDDATGSAVRATGDGYTQTAIQSTYDAKKKCEGVFSISQDECNVLVSLFDNLGGKNWRSTNADDSNALDTWKRLNDPCEWHGVTCTDGAVTGLDLSGEGLVGTIPGYLGNLSVLKSLDLSNNLLSGEIPYIFQNPNNTSPGYLRNLQSLDLSGNNLTSSDNVVTAFVTALEPDWQATQTPLANGSFEGGKSKGIPVIWGNSNTSTAGKDKQKCDKPGKTVAYDGECAFMFKGNSNGTKSKIKQVIADTSEFINGATVTLSVYVDNRSASANKVFSKLIVVYTDGSKSKISLRLPSGAGYKPVSGVVNVAIPAGHSIDKVKMDFRWTGTSGKFFLDGALLTITPGTSALEVNQAQQRMPTTTNDVSVPAPEGFRK